MILPTKFVALDAMHCLLLGCVKSVLRTYVTHGALSDEMLTSMEEIYSSHLNLSSRIGRLPSSWVSSLLSFKAAQTKHFALDLATYLFIAVDPDVRSMSASEIEWWEIFANAIRVLCARQLTRTQVSKAIGDLSKFYKHLSQRFGATCGRICGKLWPPPQGSLSGRFTAYFLPPADSPA